MNAINLALFHALRTDHALTGALLWLAEHGDLLGAALVGWVIVRFPQERIHGLAIVMAALLASALAQSLADALNVARPYMVGLGAPRIPHGPRGALPSAHATVMFTVTLLLWRRRELRWTAAAATLLAVVTCWGRIHAGVHFPLDIAAGLLLAFMLAALVHLTLRSVALRLPAHAPLL